MSTLGAQKKILKVGPTKSYAKLALYSWCEP